MIRFAWLSIALLVVWQLGSAAGSPNRRGDYRENVLRIQMMWRRGRYVAVDPALPGQTATMAKCVLYRLFWSFRTKRLI